MMRVAAKWPRAVLIEEMNAANRARAHLLFGILVQVCAGRSLAILRAVPESNGLEAWRRLHQEYEPASAARAAAMLSALLTPVWSTSQPFLEQLLQWERACDEYRSAS
eukprot:2975495-Heterocapsa_arctica.AAC.1